MSATLRRWTWALAFVACLHGLTLPMTWISTDKSEMIVAARRLLERGSLTLGEDGSQPVPEAPWIPRRPGEKIRTRFMPGMALVFAPFVAADQALGLWQRRSMGRIVHLQGLLFVLAALGLAGRAAARLGADDASVAIAVGVLGTSWPVWHISRNGGAEPVVALLGVAYCALAEQRGAREPLSSRAVALRCALIVVLPWVHPTGVVIALALSASEWWLGPGRTALAVGAAAVAGCASVLVLWNILYHGDWLAGGYWHAGGKGYFGATSPLSGLFAISRALLLLAPVAGVLAAACALGGDRTSRLALRRPAAVTAALLALFATTSDPEPQRRLSVATLLFVLPIALGWGSLRLARGAGTLALLVSLAVGSYWFEVVAGSYYEIPGGGGFLPSVFWAELFVDHGWSALWLLPACGLLAGLAFSWLRTYRLLDARDGAPRS